MIHGLTHTSFLYAGEAYKCLSDESRGKKIAFLLIQNVQNIKKFFLAGLKG